MNLNYLYIFTLFFFSLTISLFIIIVLENSLKKYINTPKGPQKIHKGSVSRFGGVSIILTITMFSLIFDNKESIFFFKILLASIPVFVVGFFEDITQSITPKVRLIGSLLSAILTMLIFDISVNSIGISIFDFFMEFKIISILFTILCIVFLIQAFNIIDGLNGLSLITAMICLFSMSIIAFQLDDINLSKASIYLFFILFGVLILNFPFGKIFIGDAGAYLIGLYIAIFSIALIEKNINISPFVIALILIYPSYELFRSFLRRLILKKGIFRPDTNHLHSLLYTFNKYRYSSSPLKANVYSSLMIISVQILICSFVINFYKNEFLIIVGIFAFIILYEIINIKLIKNIKKINKNS